MAMRPVNRIKHVVDNTGTPAVNTALPFILADASDTPTIGVTNSVKTGCTINGFYIRLEVAVKTTVADALANCYLAIWKNPANNMTAPAINLVGSSDTKCFFIHQEMVMLENRQLVMLELSSMVLSLSQRACAEWGQMTSGKQLFCVQQI